jgi:hypothetical protein
MENIFIPLVEKIFNFFDTNGGIRRYATLEMRINGPYEFITHKKVKTSFRRSILACTSN